MLLPVKITLKASASNPFQGRTLSTLSSHAPCPSPSYPSNEKIMEKTGRQQNRPSVADIIIGTSLGFGFWPWGPGTAGAVFGTLVWWLYAWLLPSYTCVLSLTLVLIVGVTLISIAPINRLERFWGADPSRVVIDETVGVWVTLMAVPQSREWYYVLAAFLLFRIMDIWKPLGCRRIDRHVRGGWGVMLDDILAGVYGAIVLLAVRWGVDGAHIPCHKLASSISGMVHVNPMSHLLAQMTA